MADDLMILRRKRKNLWRQQEEERRSKILENDTNSDTCLKSKCPPSIQENVRNQIYDANKQVIKENVVAERDHIYGLNKQIKGVPIVSSANIDDGYSKKVTQVFGKLAPYAEKQLQSYPTNIGLLPTSTSPSSTVTFSQSPGNKVMTSVRLSSRNAADDGDGKISFLKRTNALFNERKRPLQLPDDDSSSSDEDIVELAKERDRKKALREAQQNVNQQVSRDIVATRDSIKDIANEPINPVMRATNESTLHPSSLFNSSAQRSANDRKPSEDNETPPLAYPVDGRLLPTLDFSPKIARNPLAMMKEKSKLENVVAASSKASEANLRESKLWSDSDESLQKLPVQSSKRKSDQHHKKKTIRKKNNELHQEKSDEKQKTSEKVEHQIQLDDDESDCESNSREIEQQKHDNMPEFDNPNFGPFAYEPLLLSTKSEDDDKDIAYEVPASINRYLPGYQREGIKFIFDAAIVSKRGAVLGDDMGLGKTIQIVALVAALLEKSGTGADLLELIRRKSLVKSKREQMKKENDTNLLQGRIPTNDMTKISFDKELKLPHWNPMLIVVPNTVAQNWVDSFQNWGHFAVALYQGTNRESQLLSVRIGINEIMICPKSMFERKEHFNKFLLINWKIIVIDEFHTFKNEKSHLAKNLTIFRDTLSCVVIGLTGTLMQNDHKELWTLIELTSKGYLGSWKEFEKKYANPIKWSRTTDADDDVIDCGRQKSLEFSNILSTIYIQRTKDQVLADELPMKDERIVFCEPSSLQKDLYRYILTLPDFRLLSESSGPCDCGVNQKFFLEFQHLQTKEERINYQRRYRDKIITRAKCCYQVPGSDSSGDVDKRAVLWRKQHDNDITCENCPFCILFPALNILYKVSSHASLLQVHTTPDQFPVGSSDRRVAEENFERAKVLIPKHLVSFLPGQSYVRKTGIMDNHFGLSGKMVVVDKLLQAIQKQQGRVLIFSYSTQTMDLIENYLVSEGYSYLRMDGTTSCSRRTELVNEFKKCPDIFVFLLSTKAMGLGLNLTEANFVIIYDVDWNPSNDAQAQDRAYRIGQERDVKVFRLVCRGTVEELKYLRQVYKTQLKSETIIDVADQKRASAARFFRGVAGAKERKGELFGITNLLKFRDGTFMNYAPKESESCQYGVGVHDTTKVLEIVQNMTEEEFEEIGNGSSVHQDIAMRTEPVASEHTSEYELATTAADQYENTYNTLGGESQMILDICDREEIHHSTDENHISDQNVLEVAEISSVNPTQCVDALLPVKNVGSNHLAKETSIDCDSSVASSDASSCSPINISVSKAKKQTFPGKRSPRNTVLVGKTTSQIKRGKGGQTTFSAFDLYLPADSRRKDKKA